MRVVFTSCQPAGGGLVVHEGPGSCEFLKDDKNPNADQSVDWEFIVWTPENFHELFNDPTHSYGADQPEFGGELPPPRLDVYITPGRLDWAGVKVPPGLSVDDQRATANGYKPGDGAVVRGDVYDMLTSKPVPSAQVLVEQYFDPKNLPKGWEKAAAIARHLEHHPPHEPTIGWQTVATLTTNPDGHFEGKQIPAGSSRVSLRCAGYAPRLLSLEVRCTADSLNTFTTRLAPAATIDGIVTDTAGKPVPNVKVGVNSVIALDGRGYPMGDGPQTTTDAAGHFTLSNLPTGHAPVFAQATGFWQLDLQRLYQLPAEKLQLKIAAIGAIHGRVTLAPDQKTSGIGVRILRASGGGIGPWTASLGLNPDGAFVFDNVPPGDYFLCAVAQSAKPDPFISKTSPNTRTLTLPPGQTAEVELPFPIRPPGE